MTVVDALVEECDAIAAAVAPLADADFDGPTNCPPWTVKELLVHIWGTILLPRSWNPGEGDPVRAADYYRRAERETPEYRTVNVTRSQGAAARFASGHDAARALAVAAADGRRRLADTDLSQVIGLPNTKAISLADYLVTRVVSVAIHGLDVAISLDIDPFTTPRAEAIAVTVLEELLGTGRTKLGWTASQLIAWTTGRLAAPPEALDRLGDRALLLPLIS